jgi:hypothetical protein
MVPGRIRWMMSIIRKEPAIALGLRQCHLTRQSSGHPNGCAVWLPLISNVRSLRSFRITSLVIGECTMSSQDLDRANLLWDEYKYRHEHCWKVVIQITTALVILSVIPYTEKEVVRVLRHGIIAIPLLALGLVGFSFLIMWRELVLFAKIKKEYRDLQGRLNIVQYKTKSSRFTFFVLFYIFCLFVMGLFNLYFVWSIWIPYVLSLPNEATKIVP